MSQSITLSANLRDAGKNLQTLRKEGKIPAVVYGHGVAPKSISLDRRAFTRAFKEAGENTIVEVSIDSEKPANVLIKEVQLDPMSNRFIHADFFEVRMDEEVEADIPFEFVGESPAVKALGGMLVKALESVHVKALPLDLPHAISVDISTLETFDNVIKVKDLLISKKVSLQDDGETVVVLVEAPRTEAELEKLNEKVETDVTKVEKSEKKPEEKPEESK